jgi:glucose-6-phosphate 1-dehydrogenase
MPKSPNSPGKCTIIIFGATGDLTKRKLIPSLYHLYAEGKLDKSFSVLGVSRREMRDEDLRKNLKAGVKEFGKGEFDEKIWKTFSEGIFSTDVEYDDKDSYRRLKEKIEKIDTDRKTGGNRLFYLAIPPEAYGTVVTNIGEAGLHKKKKNSNWTRIIVEKPIGYDLSSAVELNNNIGEVFSEDEIFRIDHFLGKETVQNLLAFRFANGIFEPIWNRNYIDHVQITTAETVGVENRAGYYEKSGALRDMVQNHLLQVLAHIAMEAPARFDATTFRDEKVKVYDSIQPVRPTDVDGISVRAQYGRGKVNGKILPAYRNEKGVARNSKTETYVALKLVLDNWRWAGVPFFLRTGKRMAKRTTQVVLVFKQAPHQIFSSFEGLRGQEIESNVLIIRIQPDEGISLCFGAKVPGPGMAIKPVTMDFSYAESFDTKIADAYERLLLDAMLGDATLFARRDMVETCWEIINPFLEAWENSRVRKLPTYPSGSWGPKESIDFINKFGCCCWRED